MFHTYEEALEWIHSRLRLGIKPGLSRMEWMMSKLDHPENRIKSIHIGGTNGKGSTVTFLRNILQAAGYKVGTFTSPYIEQFNERISIDGKPITDQEILDLTNKIKPLADELENTDLGGPTEFEIITAMSLYFFGNRRDIDFVIYEVGLGGRYDSTNVITPLVSVITNIGLDHTNILGNSYEEIAFEKAGIIKQGIPVICGAKMNEAVRVITKQAETKNAHIYLLSKDIYVKEHSSESNGELFTLKTPKITIENLFIPMMGKHQTENASLAVVAAYELTRLYEINITVEKIREGLANAFWPGRLEIVSEKPLVIVDGAHNDEGIEALCEVLKTRFRDRKIHVLFAALIDKKLDKMISQLDQAAETITFATFDFPRAAPAEELHSMSKNPNRVVSNDWEEVIKRKLKELDERDLFVITGSLYFISEVKKKIFQNLKD